MYTFSNENPTTIHYDSFLKIMQEGDELSPRGKKVKELRPVSIEYKNPLNRVTFMPTRRINPFFQLAESFQILSGVNDAKWLSMFNANMMSFSDNGDNYNAFYGERIRHWGDGVAHNTVAYGRDGEGDLDQLYDVYLRILEDKDTRQAMMAIGNPTFDNYRYLNQEHGKDVACLTGDTLIATPMGHYPICELKEESQYVCSFNEATGRIDTSKILAISKTKKDADILQVNFENGDNVKCTKEHQFYLYSVDGFGLKQACELAPGDNVICIDYLILDTDRKAKKGCRVTSVEYLDEKQDVYDITVEGNHNFFANSMLVHNCNLYITFKIRHDKLEMVVFNRSNDLIFGTFGANLCQFSTIQETLASWLRNSGVEEFKNIQVGSYHQVTDSLHIYLEDYGAKAAQSIENYFKDHQYIEPHFQTNTEPCINSSFEKFQNSINYFWDHYNKVISDDSAFEGEDSVNIFLYEPTNIPLLDEVYADVKSGKIDPYVEFSIDAMIAYRLVKAGRINDALFVISCMPHCQWQFSMLYFMKAFINKRRPKYDSPNEDYFKFLATVNTYDFIVAAALDSVIDQSEENIQLLVDYLHIDNTPGLMLYPAEITGEAYYDVHFDVISAVTEMSEDDYIDFIRRVYCIEKE